MNSLFFSSSVADPHHKRKLGLLPIFTCMVCVRILIRSQCLAYVCAQGMSGDYAATITANAAPESCHTTEKKNDWNLFDCLMMGFWPFVFNLMSVCVVFVCAHAEIHELTMLQHTYIIHTVATQKKK